MTTTVGPLADPRRPQSWKIERPSDFDCHPTRAQVVATVRWKIKNETRQSQTTKCDLESTPIRYRLARRLSAINQIQSERKPEFSTHNTTRRCHAALDSLGTEKHKRFPLV